MEKPLHYFLLRPYQWPGLIFMSFAWLIAQMPFSVQLYLAKGLSKLLLKYAKTRRRIAEINLNICFPDKSIEERKSILEQSFLMNALGIIEIASCWFTNLKDRESATELVGLEHVAEAQAQGRGVILLIFHFTSMELGGSLLGHHLDFHAMYKPNKKRPLIERMMRRGRLRHIHGLLTQDDAKETLKKLKQGEVVWYATDQNYGNKKGIFVPFFGTQASTVTAISKFAKMTNAVVIPFTHQRTTDLKGLKLELHPPLQDFPSASAEQDAIRINRFLEDFLKANPANYLWIHQRFRRRPAGEPPIYPPKD